MFQRALYHSLRMQWLHDSSLIVEPWQVADYRSLPLSTLFQALTPYQLSFDRTRFVQEAENYDTPEEMAEGIEENLESDDKSRDYLYLIIFELWRRLVPEKRSLSLFCDELDTQIQLYYLGQIENIELLEDAINSLLQLLQEQVDEGEELAHTFALFQESMASDLEAFLYDYISTLIDHKEYDYAEELIQGFQEAIEDVKWFVLLEVRLALAADPDQGHSMLHLVVREADDEKELDYQLELLALLVQAGEKQDFSLTIKRLVPLLQTEEDFQDLLTISEDYFHCIDHEKEAGQIHQLLTERSTRPLEAPFSSQDPAVRAFLGCCVSGF